MFKLEEVLKEVSSESFPKKENLEFLLSLGSLQDISSLFSFADHTRERYCGNGVILRGIVEFSSFCNKPCFYCGLNKNNRSLKRYRLNKEQILDCADSIRRSGVKTIVLQSGDDDALDPYWLADVIKEIKDRYCLAVTLCVGEKELDEYRLWKEAGANRYLLKMETYNEKLYESLHPGMSFHKRLKCLRLLKDLGFQTGSGNIIGLKGQSVSDIADDILFFKSEDYDMVSISPFIPHLKTELKDQAAGSAALTLKALALARIILKDTHLPATTALGSLGEDLRIDALKAGANVLMPNFTPMPYRKEYEIYPGKRCIDEPVGACASCVSSIVGSIGRFIDDSVGDSLKVKTQIG